MKASDRIVTKLPLQELWRDDGFATASRRRYLLADEIADLLRAGRVQFVVADVGFALRWISSEKCFEFWKTEARAHLAEPGAKAVLDEFPGGYCYFASEWSSQNETALIVLLEKHH